MDFNTRQQIERELRNRFYYISYPDNLPEGLWRDREDKVHAMSDMGLDHLKASINLVERDITKFIESTGHPKMLPNITDLLVPLASQKLAQLRSAFNEKIGSRRL